MVKIETESSVLIVDTLAIHLKRFIKHIVIRDRIKYATSLFGVVKDNFCFFHSRTDNKIIFINIKYRKQKIPGQTLRATQVYQICRKKTISYFYPDICFFNRVLV
jgi:hypothetical protein